MAKIGFDADQAQLYDKSRPGYPNAAFLKINSILKEAGANRPRVVEVGAGTGIFTEGFLRSGIPSGGLLAVEPSDGFREALITRVKGMKHISVHSGTGDSLPVPVDESHTYDACLIAQAFHWMSNKETLLEIRRCLKRTNAPIILIWNGYDRSIGWQRDLEDDVILPLYPEGVPRYQSGYWKQAFVDAGEDRYGPLQFHYEPNTHIYEHLDRKECEVVSRILSISVCASRPEQEKVDIRERILLFLATHPETKDKAPKDLVLTYRTELAWSFPRHSNSNNKKEKEKESNIKTMERMYGKFC